jgi:replication factor C small subunit
VRCRMDDVWVEKYRPRVLSEVAGQPDIVDRLSAYVKSGNLPHLLFAGSPGTGKTTCAIALAKELFKDVWKNNFHELNASDERGIDIVRGKVKDFARTAPFGDAPFKIIFLDEADALTNDAQAALRRTMERYTATCRFVLSCNYSSKIIEPIQSRCAVFRFRRVSDDAVRGYLGRISQAEGLAVDQGALDAIVHFAEGDMRRATNALQVAAASSKKIDQHLIYTATATARPGEIRELLEIAVSGAFGEARKRLDGLLVNYGLSGEDLIKQMHRELVESTIDDGLKVMIADRMGETEFRLVGGASERIQILALLAYMAGLKSKKNRLE